MRRLLIPALLAGSVIAAPADTGTEPHQPKPMIEINGQILTDLDFAVFSGQARKRGADITDQETQVHMLNELVRTVMMAQEAEKAGLAENAEIQSAVALARYKLLAEVAIKNHLRGNPVTDEEIETEYQRRNTGQAAHEFKARHILVESEDEAKAVIAELQAGADFRELAKQKSTGPSGPNGGDLGWFGPNQMVEPFSKAVQAMSVGSFTEAPVKTRFGWHVILLEDQRDNPPPSFEQVRDSIEKELTRKRVAAYVNDVNKSSKVTLKIPGEPDPGTK